MGEVTYSSLAGPAIEHGAGPGRKEVERVWTQAQTNIKSQVIPNDLLV